MLNYCKECKCHYMFYCHVCEVNKNVKEYKIKENENYELSKKSTIQGIDKVEKYLNENPKVVNKLLANLIINQLNKSYDNNNKIIDDLIWKDLKYEK